MCAMANGTVVSLESVRLHNRSRTKLRKSWLMSLTRREKREDSQSNLMPWLTTKSASSNRLYTPSLSKI